MTTFLKRRWIDLLAVLVAAVLLGWLATFLPQTIPDRAYLALRYAQNLIAGNGFTFNPGNNILLHSVSPLYAALVAFVATFSAGIFSAVNVIQISAILLGGLALFAMLIRVEEGLHAPTAAALFMSFPLLWLLPGIETNLWLSLCLLATTFHVHDLPFPTALLLAVAMLIRVETAILLIVLLADGLSRGLQFKTLPAGVLIGTLALGLLWMQITFGVGASLPGLNAAAGADVIANTLPGALLLLGSDLLNLSWLWIATVPLLMFGIIALKDQRPALLLLGWAVAHLVTLSLLSAPATTWSLTPLVVALCAVSAVGIHKIVNYFENQWLQIAGGALLALALLAAPGLSLYKFSQGTTSTLALHPPDEAVLASGEWLKVNTPVETEIATTTLGALAYTADRALLDYRGRLQTDFKAAYERGDTQWWIGVHTPAYLVLREAEYPVLDGFDLNTDPWFGETYVEAARFAGDDGVVILQRMSEVLPLEAHLVNLVNYDNGLTLNGIATDFALAPLETARTGRVRLEWLISDDVHGVEHVAVRIQSRDGNPVATLGRPLNFDNWPRRELLHTYHTLQLPQSALPGLYTLEVGVGPDPFNLTWAEVTTAKVPFPESTFLGALSGVQADFGEIKIDGYRLARTEQGLEVLLMWETLSPPQANYQVLIQVRDAQGTILTQVTTEPLAGSYPTSIWSSGERIPDTYVLDDTTLSPGSYEVYAALITPDDNRVLTVDGRDAVLIGPVNIVE